MNENRREATLGLGGVPIPTRSASVMRARLRRQGRHVRCGYLAGPYSSSAANGSKSGGNRSSRTSSFVRELVDFLVR